MEALRVEQAGDLLRVTMSRPEQRNAFDAALIQELTEALTPIFVLTRGKENRF